MPGQDREVVVGLDNGEAADQRDRARLHRAVPGGPAGGDAQPGRGRPGRGHRGSQPRAGRVLSLTGFERAAVRAVGLDTPGPASADGVISTRGAVNFADPAWRGFDVRGALEARLGLPVIYNNDANAASLYAHHMHFGAEAPRRSSVALIVGTGLGGGVVEGGWCGARPGCAASSGTSRSRWTGCWHRGSRRRCATAGWPGTGRASRRWRPASRRTCCPTG